MVDICHIYYCSFCNKPDNDPAVTEMIIAHRHSNSGICNQCVDMCNEIIASRKPQATEPAPPQASGQGEG